MHFSPLCSHISGRRLDTSLPRMLLQQKVLTTQCKIEFTYQSQKPPNFKVVLEWKNGSKHPILSIYMANNVTSYTCLLKKCFTLAKVSVCIEIFLTSSKLLHLALDMNNQLSNRRVSLKGICLPSYLVTLLNLIS